MPLVSRHFPPHQPAHPAPQPPSHITPSHRLHLLPGLGLQATVVAVDSRRRALDVTLVPQQQGAAALQPPARGSTVLGRITSVGGAGVRVQLGACSSGRVALTDIHDGPVQQALAGLEAGQYVQAAVVGPDPAASSTGGKGRGGGKADGATSQLLLSLRPSDGGHCAAHAAAAAAEQQPGGGEAPTPAAELQATELKPGQKVRIQGRIGATAGIPGSGNAGS